MEFLPMASADPVQAHRHARTAVVFQTRATVVEAYERAQRQWVGAGHLLDEFAVLADAVADGFPSSAVEGDHPVAAAVAATGQVVILQSLALGVELEGAVAE